MSDEPNPDPQIKVVDVDEAEMVERFRRALMVAHAHDWDMDTVSEAAHICAAALSYPVAAGSSGTQQQSEQQ